MTYLVIYLGCGLVFGCITQAMSEEKGYETGFAWGFWLGIIGIIVVACKPDMRLLHSYADYNKNSYLSDAAEEKRKQETISSGGWICQQCGRTNQSHTGTCACGLTKNENGSFLKKQMEEKEIRYKDERELVDIQKLKAYKDLLDSGVISQEEFEKKKNQLLNFNN